MFLDVNPHQFTALFPSLGLGLKDHELEALLGVLEYEELSAGETPIAQGTEADALYLVWGGSLTVVVETGEGESEVGVVGPGSMLGEVTLMDPGPASATVRCEQGCTALVLPRGRLEQLWRDHPRVAAKFLRQLARQVAERIRSTTIQLNRLYAKQDTTDLRNVRGMLLTTGGH